MPCQKLPQRILAAYILYSLYAPHPISINPFKSALFDTFTKERKAAVQLAGEGKASDNEQLVWVLWKVLKGDGDHVRAEYVHCSITVYHSYCVAWALPTEYVGSRISAAQVKSRKSGFGREGIS